MMVVIHGLLSSGARRSRSSFSVPFLFFAAMAPAVADTNSWTKPTSGDWEEQAQWSLGVLPDATQSVLFTNAGWKALAIGAGTAQNFPQSMSVQSLTVGAPVDSSNTLLMNWSGLERPLQTTSLIVGSNSSVLVQGSALEVISTSTDGSTGNLFIGGTFIHSDFSQVKVHGVLTVLRRFGPWDAPALYFLTNGTLSAGYESVGGMEGPGEFVQYGGANNVGSLGVGNAGDYHLYGGQATATNGMTVGFGDFASGASFVQYGGSLNADTVINGYYFLNGGTITGRMSVPSATTFDRADGHVFQNGGTNFALSLDLGLHAWHQGGEGSYVLSNGVLRVGSSFTLRGGTFSQFNGVHTIVSNLDMRGDALLGETSSSAWYVLESGTLSAAGLTAQPGTFQQNGGTNLIAEDIVLTVAQSGIPFPQAASYMLDDGFLSARNVIVNTRYGGFHQTGGTHVVSNELRIATGTYDMSGGSLTGGSLVLASTNAAFNQTGGSVSDGSVTGLLYMAAGTYRLAGGLLRVPHLFIPESPDSTPASFDATFVQTGGTNDCEGALSVYRAYGTPNFPQTGPGRYVLSNGVLRVVGQSGADAGGDFQQWGGWHTNGVTVVRGYGGAPEGSRVARFTLGGGMLETPGILMEDLSVFLQSGGTNRVSGQVDLEFLAGFTLTGGLLTAPRTFVGPSCFFAQSGGTHMLNNVLVVSGNYQAADTNGYFLTAGQLTTPEIQLFGGNFRHIGGSITVPSSLTLSGGAWDEQTQGQQFGPLSLGENGGTISFPSRSSQLRFADSSSISWSSPFSRTQAVLVIQGWNGSVSGGGQHQLMFGSSSSGLTSQQLTRIRFALSGELYPARILATGEVVPERLLASSRSGNTLTLTWEPGWILQSSTNVAGPYQDVQGTASPYMPSMVEPSRFFRVRQ
jgi:hypothetical protein